MHAILLTYFYWIIFTINYKAESLKEDEYLDANDRHVSEAALRPMSACPRSKEGSMRLQLWSEAANEAKRGLGRIATKSNWLFLIPTAESGEAKVNKMSPIRESTGTSSQNAREVWLWVHRGSAVIYLIRWWESQSIGDITCKDLLNVQGARFLWHEKYLVSCMCGIH